jgi:hypothetical protein
MFIPGLLVESLLTTYVIPGLLVESLLTTYVIPGLLVIVARPIRFLCYIFRFVCFRSNLCLVYPILPVSLDCSFLIDPSVFSNVSLIKCVNNEIQSHFKLI